MVILRIILRTGVFSFIMLLLMGCPEELPEHDLTIQIKNNTNETIVFFAPIAPVGKTNEAFDTTLTEVFPWGDASSIANENIVKPNSIGLETHFTYHMQDVLNQGFMHYYIFNYDSLISIPWERIRDEYIVAKRVDFDTWEELEAADFTVTYP